MHAILEPLITRIEPGVIHHKGTPFGIYDGRIVSLSDLPVGLQTPVTKRTHQ